LDADAGFAGGGDRALLTMPPVTVLPRMTEVPVIEMKLVVAPAGLVTEACGVVMVSPAFAGAARRSATSEVVAKSEP
jgi:hypothetical protein